jgi:hypothetical protein
MNGRPSRMRNTTSGAVRSRFPPGWRRYAKSPAAPPGTEVACANSRTVAMPPLCSVLRYALLALFGRMSRALQRCPGLPGTVGSISSSSGVWNVAPAGKITKRQIGQCHVEVARDSLARIHIRRNPHPSVSLSETKSSEHCLASGSASVLMFAPLHRQDALQPCCASATNFPSYLTRKLRRSVSSRKHRKISSRSFLLSIRPSRQRVTTAVSR